MKLTVWGARGSIPVSGEQYVRYGGDTTCVELETADGDLLILDAGSGLRALGNRVLKQGRTEVHFLLSHAHWDHLLGFPFFKPLYRKGVKIHFHGCTFAQSSIRTFLAQTMRPPFFPVKLESVAAQLVFADECRSTFGVAGLVCHSIQLNHPNQGYGFRLCEGDRSLGFFPDNELDHAHPGGKSFDEYVEFLRDVDLLIHDAEYLPDEYERLTRGWGHSAYPDTVRLASAARVGRLLMWHLNQDRDDDGVDALLALAKDAAGDDFQCLMARTGLQLTV